MKKNDSSFYGLLGKRLKNIRRKYLKISAEKLAEILGISEQQIRRYEQGIDKISLDKLAIIEDKYKIPLQYFYNAQTEINHLTAKNHVNKKNSTIPTIFALDASEIIDSSKYQSLPVYSYTGAGKFIDLTEIEPIDNLLIPKEFAVNGSIAVVKVIGKSMEPVIREGAYIGVEKDNKIFVSGNIYAVYLPYEGAVIKKVYLNLDSVILKSENKDFPDIVIPLKDIDKDNFIIGKVKWVLQKF